MAIHRVSSALSTPITRGDGAVGFGPFTTLHNTATTPVPIDDEARGFAELSVHRLCFQDLLVRKIISEGIVPAKFKRAMAKIRRSRKKRGTLIPEEDDAC